MPTYNRQFSISEIYINPRLSAFSSFDKKVGGQGRILQQHKPI